MVTEMVVVRCRGALDAGENSLILLYSGGNFVCERLKIDFECLVLERHTLLSK